MRFLKSLFHASCAATISVGMFGGMLMMLGWSPRLPQADIAFDAGPELSGVYSTDVDAAVAMLEEAYAPAPEPAPVPAPVPEKDSKADPDMPSHDPDLVRQILEAQNRPRSRLATPRSTPRPSAERVVSVGSNSGGDAVGTQNKKRRRRPCVEGSDSIKALGDNRFAVERDLIDHYSGDLREASKLAMVHWYRESGEVIGFKVRRIRCGSVLFEAGFRNGDVIHRINGKPVTTIPQALFAYRKLRKKKRLNVEVTRRDGTRVNLRYRLT